MIIETRARQGGKTQAMLSSILGPGWVEDQLEGVRSALSEGVMDMAQGPVTVPRIPLAEIKHELRRAQTPRAYAFLEALGMNPADVAEYDLRDAERDLIARELLALGGA